MKNPLQLQIPDHQIEGNEKKASNKKWPQESGLSKAERGSRLCLKESERRPCPEDIRTTASLPSNGSSVDSQLPFLRSGRAWNEPEKNWLSCRASPVFRHRCRGRF